MISKIKYLSLSILILFLASCASSGPQKPAVVQKKTAPVVAPVKKISSKNSFAPIFGARDPRLAWWGLYEKAPTVKRFVKTRRNFDVFDKREFLFEKPQKHEFENVTARTPLRMKEYSGNSFNYDWRDSWRRFFGVLITLLLGSIAWRGLSLIALFFGLWRRHQREVFFNKDLIAVSNLVPPVSLCLSSKSSGTELLAQISAVENLDYEEVELIVFRDVKSKDDDAMLLKDFRLRFRSPLYFADLDTEDPFEILEVQGERRILLVYSDQKTLRPSLALFLKLARYPLVGFLNERVILNSDSIANLVFRWLRDGEKSTCVYGFLDELNSGPSTWLEREWAFLNGIGDSGIENWIRDKRFFGLMPKNMAIQLMEFGGGRYQSALWSELPSFEIVGTKKSESSGFRDLMSGFVMPIRNVVEFVMSGLSWKGIKSIADQVACFLAAVLWPIILVNFVVLLVVARQVEASVFFLAGSEALLLILTAAIWFLFPRNTIRNVFPSRSGVLIQEQQQVSA